MESPVCPAARLRRKKAFDSSAVAKPEYCRIDRADWHTSSPARREGTAPNPASNRRPRAHQGPLSYKRLDLDPFRRSDAKLSRIGPLQLPACPSVPTIKFSPEVFHHPLPRFWLKTRCVNTSARICPSSTRSTRHQCLKPSSVSFIDRRIIATRSPTSILPTKKRSPAAPCSAASSRRAKIPIPPGRQKPETSRNRESPRH